MCKMRRNVDVKSRKLYKPVVLPLASRPCPRVTAQGCPCFWPPYFWVRRGGKRIVFRQYFWGLLALFSPVFRRSGCANQPIYGFHFLCFAALQRGWWCLSFLFCALKSGGFVVSRLTLVRDFEMFFPGLSSPLFSLLTELSAYRSHSEILVSFVFSNGSVFFPLMQVPVNMRVLKDEL